ncbi:MAG: dTDP-4-dehydrorhamnose reductase [Chitinophagales bacterium]|nr:dTDP-4-dehydrorhamnose reductase [Chitinophagales bacterium]
MKKIWISGADGQLGTELCLLFSDSKTFEIYPTSIKDIDLINSASVQDFSQKNNFDIIINCAAYTAVDLAESNQELNWKVNVDAVESLAQCADKINALLIHISTDFVFDGSSTQALKESDLTNPLQEYGRAKLAGEAFVQKGIVIRTSWLYSPYGNNFVKTMLRLGREKEQINVVANQIGTPTCAEDLAKLIYTMCQDEEIHTKLGLYHYSNEGVASWYDFAQSIMEYAELSCAVFPIPDTGYPTPAKRPAFSVMDKSKVKERFQINIPYWRTSLKSCIQKIKENESRN